MKLTRRGKLVAIVLGVLLAWILYRVADANVAECLARGVDEWRCRR